MRRLLRLTALSIAAVCAFASSGCVKVKPWEREILSRPDMAWEPDPLEAAFRTHVHFSKEASLPAGGAGGGGCGCN